MIFNEQCFRFPYARNVCSDKLPPQVKDIHHCLLQPGIKIRPLFFKGLLRHLFNKQKVLCINVIQTSSTQLSVSNAPLTNTPVFHMEIYNT